MQKKLVISGAIESMSPMNRQHWAMAQVKITARRGSSPLAVPLANGLMMGKRLSLASACRTRLPPNRDPSADEMVEIIMPMTTTYLFTQASCMTFMLALSVERGNDAPMVSTMAT